MLPRRSLPGVQTALSHVWPDEMLGDFLRYDGTHQNGDGSLVCAYLSSILLRTLLRDRWPNTFRSSAVLAQDHQARLIDCSPPAPSPTPIPQREGKGYGPLVCNLAISQSPNQLCAILPELHMASGF